MKKTIIGYFVLCLLLAIVFVAPGFAQTAKAQKAPPSPAMPSVVYVTDFAIDSGDITSQDRPIMKRLQSRRDDPEAKAAKLTELLSSTLTSELQKKSIPAQRLYTSSAGLDKGWLVQGQFLEVDEGNRLRRAVVGFGSGQTEMQIQVAIVDLGSGDSRPFLVFGTDSQSGKAPGAVVTMNPYVAAAKFVMSKKASEKDVKKTAKQIAEAIATYIQGSKAPAN